MTKGLIYIFTGDGKGKTSAALGVAMRAVGHGKRVAMVQWYKEKKWKIGEHNLPLMLKRTNEPTRNATHSVAGGQTNKRTNKTIGSFEIYPMGRGFYKLPTDHAGEEEHRQAANKALKLSRSFLVHHPSSIIYHPLFLLVLDEVLNAVNDGLIELNQLIELISLRGSTHLILTGRNAPHELIEMADLVTEMKNLKHPYDEGQKAVLGLDF